MEQHRPVEIGDVEVFPSVVVIIADCGAESPAATVQASFAGNIGEGSVVVVAVELAGMAFPRAQIFERRSVHQKNIHPAVIVVIKDGDAPAHSFHDVSFFQASAREVKIDARGPCDIGKGNRRCRAASG